MSSSLQRFRSYEIAEDSIGGSLELWRTDREVVCLASQPAEQRWVELHVLAGVDTQDPACKAAVDGFRMHVQGLLRVRDRRVLEVLEAGEDEGALFYVSEFVDGEMLDGYLARCTPLPAWWALEIARQLTLGLMALRSLPALLGRVQVFNARLTLEGEATADALVKLADFDLGAPPGGSPSASAAESRAVKEVGRLLCYSLSGLVAEQITSRQLAALPLPPEVADLLARLLGRPGRSSLADLPGLLAALSASALSPSLATAPDRLPPALRSRLPLAAHFPTLPRLATEAGERLRLERTPFDAAQPYAQRAFEGATPVTVQLLPPARLLTPAYLRQIRHAAERQAARPTPHSLRVLELATIDEPGWFLEEGAPRLSLDRVRRLRRTLTPAEAAFLLKEFDIAVLALESRGLSPVGLCPQEVFLDFSHASQPVPGDDVLAAQPIHAWPVFMVKLRAHPITAQLAQPRRFLRERLLDAVPPRSVAGHSVATAAGLGSPTPADYAALFAWLCGGLGAVPTDLSPVISGTLSGKSATSRAGIVDALAPLIPKPAKPNPTKSAPTPASPSRPVREPAATKSGGKSRRSKAAARAAALAKKSVAAAPAAELPPSPAPRDPTETTVASTGFLSVEPVEVWEGEGGPANEVLETGFAEMLMGSSADSGVLTAPEREYPLTPALAADRPEDELPIGTLFGAWPGDLQSREPADPDNEPQYDFSSRVDLHGGPGWGRLVIMVVLVAMVIAVLMAHFTGLAPWR